MHPVEATEYTTDAHKRVSYLESNTAINGTAHTLKVKHVLTCFAGSGPTPSTGACRAVLTQWEAALPMSRGAAAAKIGWANPKWHGTLVSELL